MDYLQEQRYSLEQDTLANQEVTVKNKLHFMPHMFSQTVDMALTGRIALSLKNISPKYLCDIKPYNKSKLFLKPSFFFALVGKKRGVSPFMTNHKGQMKKFRKQSLEKYCGLLF